VVLLDQQRVVADGTHAELLESTPLYAEVLAQAAEFEREADLEGSDADVADPDGSGRGLADLLESVRGGAHR
jgi:hypothetical protein